MRNRHLLIKSSLLATAAAFVTLSGMQAYAANLALSDSPLFLSANVPPMNMLVMGRDHKLYYEAYNDHSDLNGDGTLDIGYKGWELKSPAPATGSPYKIDYYGYFDSFKCYTYISNVFVPAAVTTNKKCSGQWSGDFLNYLTMTRIDAMRKVLYGGRRVVDTNDTASGTVLERSHVPQDAHSWGKEYSTSDGYLITDYTPLPQPASSSVRHLFANTTPLYGTNNGLPLLRVLQSRSERIWEWVSTERAVAGNCLGKGQNTNGTCKSGSTTVSPTDYVVRVRVCDATFPTSADPVMERNCLPYPAGNSKPTGLLQEFGENDAMKFGLISGSYDKNKSGGVLRREMGSIKDEINLNDGTFKTDFVGIIGTLNRLRITDFGGDYEYGCGWASANRVINEGECQVWGNPIAEMMYEGLRYFAGKGAANADYSIAFGAGDEADLGGGGLPVATWDNPYNNKPVCTKPFETVISDVNPSYDTDQLPGTSFGSYADSNGIAGLDVTAEANTIWNYEIGGTKKYFIGESGADVNSAPTPKDVSSFANIRGLAPEEPTKQGGYYAGSVAYYGRRNDINPNITGDQKLSTFAVALASPLPKIEIPIGTRKVTLVPFAKSVAGSSINRAAGQHQPTNQIVDFYVDSLTSTSGKFRVNFEDVEQGADHDMDAIAIYEYSVSGNNVTVKVTSEYAYGGITQHMGYIISGTTADGIYLEVLDKRDGDTAGDVDYFLDTPAAFTGTPPAPASGTGTWQDNAALPYDHTRTFTVGTTSGADLLKDPLWYAAKWGGFNEVASNVNNRPDLASEWDTDSDGNPDNYFLVTNALTLSQQLSKAFADIIASVASGSSASVNSGSITNQSRLFQAKFDTGDWTGRVLSYPINTDGSLGATASWDASNVLPVPNSRKIITVNSNGVGVPFRWSAAPNGIDNTRRSQLGPNSTVQQDVLDYIRGVSSLEAASGGQFRTRARTKLGDIINSSPVFVGRPSFTYPDSLETAPYSTFRTNNAGRTPVVYVGANDGMLHAFNADTGVELFGFIPGSVFGNLKELTKRGYTHKFFVDGTPTVVDAYFDNSWKTVLAAGLNNGGQGVYALNITNPTNFTEGNADYDASGNANGIFLWEFTDADDVDMGYSHSQPLIVRTKSTSGTYKWAAIFGNGYNNTVSDGRASTTGEAVLYVVDLATKQFRKLTTGVGVSATYSGGKPNGLTSPTAADLDADGRVEAVYAGDLFGNVWKFNLDDTNPGNWGVAFNPAGVKTPLFVATDAGGTRQPITSQVRVVRGPGSTGAVISFGTGKFLEATDSSSTSTQSLYGIYDNNAVVSGRGDLLQQTIVREYTTTSPAVEVRITSNNDPTTAHKGWYMDLLNPPNPPGTQAGERMIANPRVRNGRVIFVTVVPGSDPCIAGGKTRLTELDVYSGSRLESSPFDVNGDGRIDESDFGEIILPDGTRQPVPITSVAVSVDYGTSPGIISGNGLEMYYISGDDRDRANSAPFKDGDDIVGVQGKPGDNAQGRQSWRQIR